MCSLSKETRYYINMFYRFKSDKGIREVQIKYQGNFQGERGYFEPLRRSGTHSSKKRATELDRRLFYRENQWNKERLGIINGRKPSIAG